MIKLPMDLNSKNLSDTVIPACFWLESSVFGHWIMKYIHVFHPSGQPLTVLYVMDSHEHMSM